MSLLRLFDVFIRVALILEAVLFGGGAIALYVLNNYVWPNPDPSYDGYIVGLGLTGYLASVGVGILFLDWLSERRKRKAEARANSKRRLLKD